MSELLTLQQPSESLNCENQPVWTLPDKNVPIAPSLQKDNWFMRTLTKDLQEGSTPSIIIGGQRRGGKSWMSLKIVEELVKRCHRVKFAYRDKGLPTEKKYDLRDAQFDVSTQLLFSLRTIPNLLRKPESAGLPYGSPMIGDETSVAANALNFNSPLVKLMTEIHDTCVKGDTIILGDNKPISEYEQGNQHFGLNGLGKVNQVFKREYSGEMLRIKGHGMLPFEVTPEHPILIMRYTRPEECGWASGTNWHKTLEFRPAKDLVSKHTIGKWYNKYRSYDCLVLPIPRKNTFVRKYMALEPFAKGRNGFHRAVGNGLPPRFPLNVDTVWLLGLYAAEGNFHVTGAIFNLGETETEIGERTCRIIRGLGLTPYIDPCSSKGSLRIWLKSAVIARAFRAWCGNHAPHKQVPEFILLHRNLKLVQAFIDGYVAGDAAKNGGYKDIHGERTHSVATTVSRTLALQLQLLAMKLGSFATINLDREAGVGIINGKQVNLHARYVVSIKKGAYKNQYLKTWGYSRLHKWHDILASPIEKIEKTSYTGPVYNLETSDNTYLVSNAVVHNCGFRLLPVIFNVPGSIARATYQLRETAQYFMQMQTRGVAKVYKANPNVTGRVWVKTVGWLGYRDPFTKRVTARIEPPSKETLKTYYELKDFYFNRLLNRSERRLASLAQEGYLGPYDEPSDYSNSDNVMTMPRKRKHDIPKDTDDGMKCLRIELRRSQSNPKARHERRSPASP